MDRSRVVRIRRPPSTGDGPPFRFGSGYVVRQGQVLTAAHVLVAADPSLAADELDTVQVGDRCSVATWDALKRATTNDDIQWIDATVSAVDPASDVAVVAVEGIGNGVPPVRFGRLDDEEPVPWSAVGFPNAGLTEQGRQPERAHGDVDAVTNEFDERLGMTVTSRDTRAEDAEASGWAGLSGAAVFVNTFLIGIVVADTPQFEHSFTGVRITRALQHDDVARALQGLAIESIVAGVITATDEPDLVRVVGDRVSGAVPKWQDRDELRQWLRGVLLAGQRITSVVGRPGIGKSAVVAKVLADFEQPDPARPPPEDLDALVYLSTRTGVAALTPSHVYESIATLAQPDEAERLARLWDNMQLDAFPALWSALRHRRLVVVLDHLDDVQNGETFQLRDEGLVELLVSAGMTPHPPRVVTTSRQPLNLPPELLANVEVRELADGLSEADGVALLRSFPDHSGRIRAESDERLAQVVRTVHGIPHGLELVASIASTDQFFIDTLLESSEAPDELIEKLVSQNYEALDDAGRHVVGLLALARLPLPEPTLPSLLVDMVDTTVARTTLRHLINTRALGYEPESRLVRLHPLDADFVRRSLIHDDESLQIRLDLRLADWYAAARKPPKSWRVPADVAPNVREYEHRWRAAREPGEYSAALLPLAEAAIQIARKGNAGTLSSAVAAAEGKVTDAAGLLYVEQCRFWAEFFGGSLERAEQAARQTLDLATKAESPSLAAEMQLRLGEVLRHRGNSAEAIPILRNLVANNDSLVRDTRIFALFELGLCLCYLGDWDGADATADQLAAEVRPDDDATLRALEFDVRSLARLGAHDCDGAISAATEGMAVYADSASQDNAAYLQNVRGLAHLYSDDIEAAEREFSDATNVAKQYGQGRLEGLCAINLAWCKMSSADWPDALTFASRGAECLTRVNAKEQSIAQQLVSALTDQTGDAPTPLADALSAAAVGSRENADLYSPTAELMSRLVQQLSERQSP